MPVLYDGMILRMVLLVEDAETVVDSGDGELAEEGEKFVASTRLQVAEVMINGVRVPGNIERLNLATNASGFAISEDLRVLVGKTVDEKREVEELRRKWEAVKAHTENFNKITLQGGTLAERVNSLVTVLKAESANHETFKQNFEDAKMILRYTGSLAYFVNSIVDGISKFNKSKTRDEIRDSILEGDGIFSLYGVLYQLADAFRHFAQQNGVLMPVEARLWELKKENSKKARMQIPSPFVASSDRAGEIFAVIDQQGITIDNFEVVDFCLAESVHLQSAIELILANRDGLHNEIASGIHVFSKLGNAYSSIIQWLKSREYFIDKENFTSVGESSKEKRCVNFFYAYILTQTRNSHYDVARDWDDQGDNYRMRRTDGGGKFLSFSEEDRVLLDALLVVKEQDPEMFFRIIGVNVQAGGERQSFEGNLIQKVLANTCRAIDLDSKGLEEKGVVALLNKVLEMSEDSVMDAETVLRHDLNGLVGFFTDLITLIRRSKLVRKEERRAILAFLNMLPIYLMFSPQGKVLGKLRASGERDEEALFAHEIAGDSHGFKRLKAKQLVEYLKSFLDQAVRTAIALHPNLPKNS